MGLMVRPFPEERLFFIGLSVQQESPAPNNYLNNTNHFHHDFQTRKQSTSQLAHRIGGATNHLFPAAIHPLESTVVYIHRMVIISILAGSDNPT
jgi:hypothetical protein